MAKVTPAQITYTPTGQAEQTIRFHAVLAESHSASAQITKYPVQSGFQISNNSIRQNREVNIVGMISNYLLEGSANAEFSYSDTDNCKAIFEALESLVNSGEICTVLTNLGIYYPVVFTKFKTKQSSGKVDSMEFTLSGEEIQVASSVNGTAPKVLSFSALEGAAKKNRTELLQAIGIDVCECNNMQESSLILGQDFIIEDVNSAGLPVQTTYLATNQDPTTGVWNYEMHTNDTLMYSPKDSVISTIFDPEKLQELAKAGFSGVGECLTDNATSVATQAATDTLDTAMGELKKSLYGAVYDTVALTDNVYGQTLIQAGIGCIVRGVTGEPSDFPFSPGEALPTTDDILDAARKWGAEVANPAITKTINGLTGSSTAITKITCC